MKHFNADKTITSGRRSVSGATSVDAETVSDPEALAAALTRTMGRVASLEGSRPSNQAEYEVVCPTNSSIVIPHNLNGPVRWYVTSWKRKTGAGQYDLTELELGGSDANTLVLYSQVPGRAVIRVERQQASLHSDDVARVRVTTGIGDADDTEVLWDNAGIIDGTPKMTVSHSTGEVTHSGLPNHSETRSEFHKADTYGVAWSQWSGINTTDSTTATAFPNAITVNSGYGDGYVTVTAEVSYAFVSGGIKGGNYLKKATFHRSSGTLTRVAIEDFTKTTLQEGMIPSAVDILTNGNNTIEVKVTGLDGITVYWTESVHVQMAYDPSGGTGRTLYDFDFTTLSLGYLSDAAFLTRTGLTFTRSTISTVQTSASSLIDGALANYPVFGNIGSTLSHRGLVIQGNTWNRISGTAPNGPRNLTTGSPWTAGLTCTITYPGNSPNQANFGGCYADIVSAGACNFITFAADDATDFTFSTWQNGVGNTGTSDMQPDMSNNGDTVFLLTGGGSPATQTSTWARLYIHKPAATGIKNLQPCDARDRSAVGGQTARARHVGIDYAQFEDGPTLTEAIAVITSTGGGRTKDLLSFSPGSGWIAASGQFKFYAKFCPKAASATTVYWQTAGTPTRGTSAAWYVWSWGANGQNYAKFKDSDKKLYVKIANGTEKASTNAITWAAGDQVEFYLAAGNNVASVAKYKLNGGSWVDLVLATMTDVPAPSSGAIRVFSDDNTATGDAGALQSWLNRLTIYDTTAPSGV